MILCDLRRTNRSGFELLPKQIEGKTASGLPQVDQWLETCWMEFEVPLQALHAAPANPSVIAEAKRHLLSFLAVANARLSTRFTR